MLVDIEKKMEWIGKQLQLCFSKRASNDPKEIFIHLSQTEPMI